MHTGSASSVVWLYGSTFQSLAWLSHTRGRPLLSRCPVPQSPQEEYLFTLCNPISPRLYLFPIDSWVMVHTWLTYASVYLSQNVLWEGVLVCVYVLIRAGKKQVHFPLPSEIIPIEDGFYVDYNNKLKLSLQF